MMFYEVSSIVCVIMFALAGAFDAYDEYREYRHKLLRKFD